MRVSLYVTMVKPKLEQVIALLHRERKRKRDTQTELEAVAFLIDLMNSPYVNKSAVRNMEHKIKTIVKLGLTESNEFNYQSRVRRTKQKYRQVSYFFFISPRLLLAFLFMR